MIARRTLSGPYGWLSATRTSRQADAAPTAAAAKCRDSLITTSTSLATGAATRPYRHRSVDRAAETPRRIALIAPCRSPIAQPFAGGLEAHVWTLATALRARGHDVTLFAARGSDPDLRPVELEIDTSWLSADARRDVSMQSDLVVGEHHAYLSVMLGLRQAEHFDVVHNHSLHYLPIGLADALPMPMVTTLHTPPTPWLESAARAAGASHRFVAVSRYTSRAWRHVAHPIPVVPNGIDTGAWTSGPGGGPVVWSGRIVPEKGLHLAIEAVQLAGRDLDIAGPIVDRDYFMTRIAPRLSAQIRYVGHLEQQPLSELVRHAELAVATPDWDEPYGLVVAEALASGTPVAAFDRGGIREIIDETCARLAEPGDVVALAKAIVDAGGLDRRAARARAEGTCSVQAMVTGYEAVFDAILDTPAR